MAETFSSIGVPVVMADVKGDLSGIAKPGGGNPKVTARIQELEIEGTYPTGLSRFASGIFSANWAIRSGQPFPKWDPCLLSRLLNLNDVQSGVLTLVFKIADDKGLLVA